MIFGPFDGSMTEVRYWKTVRCVTEIKGMMASPLDIVSEKSFKRWTGMKIAKPTAKKTGVLGKLPPPGGLRKLAPPS